MSTRKREPEEWEKRPLRPSESYLLSKEMLESEGVQQLLEDVTNLNRQVRDGEVEENLQYFGGSVQPTPTPVIESIDEREERLNMPSGQETRVVDPKTGGAKGSKPSQLASAAPAGLLAVGEVCGMGAEKYDLHNYRKGYAWSLSLSALYRHILAFQGGEDTDPESGLPHMAHAAWHCLTLVQFMQDHPELDDRYKG